MSDPLLEPEPQSAEELFRPAWLTWLQWPGLTLLFAAMVVLAILAARESLGLALAFGSLFLAMLVGALCVAPRLLASTVITPEGISRKFLGWRESCRWDEIVAIDIPGRASDSYELRLRSGATIWIPLSDTARARRLRQLIDNRRPLMQLTDEPIVLGRSNHASLAYAMAGMLLLLAIVVPISSPQSTPVALPTFLLIAGLCAWLGWKAQTTLVRVDSQGITVTGSTADNAMSFADLHTIRLGIITTRHGGYEILELQGRGNRITLYSQLQGYAAIRDAVIARCPKARVLDDRPLEDR
ncbi:MAG TPA: hypothetical protein VK934_01240 [Fimbriimonas sp.]|nr:hypothetical protein [Fimbriimonas sp.]